jgi:hypothetical protein
MNRKPLSDMASAEPNTAYGTRKPATQFFPREVFSSEETLEGLLERSNGSFPFAVTN